MVARLGSWDAGSKWGAQGVACGFNHWTYWNKHFPKPVDAVFDSTSRLRTNVLADFMQHCLASLLKEGSNKAPRHLYRNLQATLQTRSRSRGDQWAASTASNTQGLPCQQRSPTDMTQSPGSDASKSWRRTDLQSCSAGDGIKTERKVSRSRLSG